MKPDIQNPSLVRLFAYWNDKRHQRSMPARADIDPIDFKYALGNVVLVDVLQSPMRFRFRLHGTKLISEIGYDLTGKILDELPVTSFGKLKGESMALVVKTTQPFHIRKDMILDGKIHNYEALILPLSADGEHVDILLIGLYFAHGAK